MTASIIIDPVPARRALLKVFLQPPHEVIECSSFGASLTTAAGRAFKAAFIAWPEGVGPATAQRANWSCDYVVLLLPSTTAADDPSVVNWCQSVLRQNRIVPLPCPEGRLTSAEISRALSRIFDTPEVAFPEMLGSSPAMRHLLELAARVAENDRPVLICGEAGTGKEALARWIHARSARGQRPFETFDAAGLEAATACSELFGHEKGAFPWAVQTKRGLLAAANEGTLYIREAGDLDRALQSKLLRLLERPSGGIERLGGQEAHNVDVRVIVGSCRPLGERLGAEFSKDLYYRLRQNYLETPPLRSRPSDIPELANYLVTRRPGASARGLKWEPRALSALQCYQWPGNLNELEEVVAEVTLKTEPGGEIKFDQLPLRIRSAGEEGGFTAAPPPPCGSRPSGDRTAGEGTWPKVGYGCDGYTMLEIISDTDRARVFLAERALGGQVCVAKFSQARNKDQRQAAITIMGLPEEDPKARNFMIPILHANNCLGDPWFMIVLDRLDDAHTGRRINRGTRQPHTFGEWITRRHWIPRPDLHDGWATVKHIEAILRALDYFHHKDLVMNDAKPENFGFYEKRLVAIDFGGFARRGVPPHEFDEVYSPPGYREGSPADDVYAVAVMLGEALYNLPPEELKPSRVPLLAEPYLREGRLFDWLVWAMIVKGLNTNPSIRYQDAQSMLKDLKELRQKLGEDGPETDGATPPK